MRYLILFSLLIAATLSANPPQTILDGTGNVYDVYGSSGHYAFEDALVVYDDAHGPYYLVDVETMGIRKTRRKEFKGSMVSDPTRLSSAATIDSLYFRGAYPRIDRLEQDKIPANQLCLALQFRELNGKGRLANEGVKAVLPIPQEEDSNYPAYAERIARVDPSSSSVVLQNFVYHKNHWFGEHYGYIDYNTHANDAFWGIFKMSDLAEALDNSPEL